MFIPLAMHMTSKAPAERPTASEALRAFETIVSSMTRRKQKARIKRPSDTLSNRFHLWISCLPNL